MTKCTHLWTLLIQIGNTFVEQIASQLDHLHAALDPQLYFNNAIILIEQTLNQFHISDSQKLNSKINHFFRFNSFTDNHIQSALSPQLYFNNAINVKPIFRIYKTKVEFQKKPDEKKVWCQTNVSVSQMFSFNLILSNISEMGLIGFGQKLVI